MRKYKIGLVIGRFQPFHLGHKYLLEKSLELCEQIIVVVAGANLSGKNNPYDSYERKEFVEDYIKEEKLESRVKKVFVLNNHPDDDVWFENLLKKSGPFDVTIGNNPWNNGIIERHGIPAVMVGFYKRRTLEGLKIRSLIIKKKKWEDRVPSYLVERLKKTTI